MMFLMISLFFKSVFVEMYLRRNLISMQLRLYCTRYVLCDKTEERPLESLSDNMSCPLQF